MPCNPIFGRDSSVLNGIHTLKVTIHNPLTKENINFPESDQLKSVTNHFSNLLMPSIICLTLNEGNLVEQLFMLEVFFFLNTNLMPCCFLPLFSVQIAPDNWQVIHALWLDFYIPWSQRFSFAAKRRDKKEQEAFSPLVYYSLSSPLRTSWLFS